MKAFILAAGLGTRLKPITNDIPKALVEVGGKTLLAHAIHQLKLVGVDEIIINIHHFGEKIISYLNEHNNFDLSISISDEREELLDTGGAILFARDKLLGEAPFFVCNVDVLSTIDLKQLAEYHKTNGGLATLAVRKRETSRYLLFDNHMLLSGWRNTISKEQILVNDKQSLEEFAFSGIHIIEPEIFNWITETGKFSLIQLYLRLAADHKIVGYYDTSDFWLDLGKVESLKRAEEYFK